MENNQHNEVRKYNDILNTYIVNVLVFMGMLLFYFFYLLSISNVYGDNKLNLSNLIEKNSQLEKKGIGYDDLLWLLSGNKDASTVLSKMGSSFYDKNFWNTSNKTYLNYLSDKSKEILNIKSTDEIQNRAEKVNKVLPAYSKWVNIEWNMSDLDFINYVENLLKTFQLQTTSNIWISSIVSTNSDSEDVKKNIDTNWSQIYYIPLSLELTGKKSDILDFLYFIQNVWVVSSTSKDKINFYKDDILASKTMVWQQRLQNYNIFENELMDISDIHFQEYINNSNYTRDSTDNTVKWFLKFLKGSDVKDESYTVTVWLKFYIKWLSIYSLTNFYQTIINNFNNTLTQSKNLTNIINSKRDLIIKNDKSEIISLVQSISMYLENGKSDINSLQDAVKSKNWLEDLYKKANNLNYDLINLANQLSSNLKIINSLK